MMLRDGSGPFIRRIGTWAKGSTTPGTKQTSPGRENANDSPSGEVALPV
jgi:hypothetical protein